MVVFVGACGVAAESVDRPAGLGSGAAVKDAVAAEAALHTARAVAKHSVAEVPTTTGVSVGTTLALIMLPVGLLHVGVDDDYRPCANALES